MASGLVGGLGLGLLPTTEVPTIVETYPAVFESDETPKSIESQKTDSSSEYFEISVETTIPDQTQKPVEAKPSAPVEDKVDYSSGSVIFATPKKESDLIAAPALEASQRLASGSNRIQLSFIVFSALAVLLL